MASTTNNLTLILGVADKQLQAGIRRAQRSIKGLGDTAEVTEKRTTKSFNRIAVNSQRSLGTARKSVARFSEALRTAVVNIKFLATALVGGALIKGVVKFSSSFETSLANINTLLDKGSVSITEYRQKLLDLSVKSSKDLKDLSKALYQVISAGISTAKESEKAFAVLERAQAAAVAGLADTEEAANAILSFVQAFKEQGLSAARAADILQKTVEKGRTTWSQLANAIGRVTPLAANFGMTAEEVGASLVTLTKAGLNTNEAVTGMRAILNGLAKPTKKARKVMKALGLDFGSARVQVIGFRGVLEELNTTTGGNVEVMAALFPNIRALLPAIVQAGDDFGTFDQALQDIEGSSGAVDTAVKKVQGTFAYTAAILKSNFQRVLVQIGEDGGVLSTVSEAVQGLSDSLAYGMKADFFGWTIDAREALAGLLKAMVKTAAFITGPLYYGLLVLAVGVVGKLSASILILTGRFLAFGWSLKSLSFASAIAGMTGFGASMGTAIFAMGASAKITAAATAMGGNIAANMTAATTTVLASTGTIARVGYGLRGLFMGAIRFAGPIAILLTFLPGIISWFKEKFGFKDVPEQDEGTKALIRDVSKDVSKKESKLRSAAELVGPERDVEKTAAFKSELGKLNELYEEFQDKKSRLDQKGVSKYRKALDDQVSATKEAYRDMANISVEGANEQQEAVLKGTRVRLKGEQRALLQQSFGGAGDTSTYRIDDLVNKEIEAITRWRAANDKAFSSQKAKFEIRADAIKRVQDVIERGSLFKESEASITPGTADLAAHVGRGVAGPQPEGFQQGLVADVGTRIVGALATTVENVATVEKLQERGAKLIDSLKSSGKDTSAVVSGLEAAISNLKRLQDMSAGRVHEFQDGKKVPTGRGSEAYRKEAQLFFKETGMIPGAILDQGKTLFAESVISFFKDVAAKVNVETPFDRLPSGDKVVVQPTPSPEFPLRASITSGKSAPFPGMPGGSQGSMSLGQSTAAAFKVGLDKSIEEIRRRLELNIREGFVEGLKSGGVSAKAAVQKINEQFKGLRVVPPKSIEAISDVSTMLVQVGEGTKRRVVPLYDFLLKNGKLLGANAKDNIQTEGRSLQLQARRLVLGKKMFGTENALTLAQAKRLAELRGGTSIVIAKEQAYQVELLKTIGISALWSQPRQKQYAADVQRINNQKLQIKNLKKSLALARKNFTLLGAGSSNAAKNARKRLADMTAKMLEDEKKLRTQVAVVAAKALLAEVRGREKAAKRLNAIIRKSAKLEGDSARIAAQVRERGYDKEIDLIHSVIRERGHVADAEIEKENQKAASQIANEKARLDRVIEKTKLGEGSPLIKDARSAFRKKSAQVEAQSAAKIAKINSGLQTKIRDGLLKTEGLRSKISQDRIKASAAEARAATEAADRSLRAIERATERTEDAVKDALARITRELGQGAPIGEKSAKDWFKAWEASIDNLESRLKKHTGVQKTQAAEIADHLHTLAGGKERRRPTLGAKRMMSGFLKLGDEGGPGTGIIDPISSGFQFRPAVGSPDDPAPGWNVEKLLKSDGVERTIKQGDAKEIADKADEVRKLADSFDTLRRATQPTTPEGGIERANALIGILNKLNKAHQDYRQHLERFARGQNAQIDERYIRHLETLSIGYAKLRGPLDSVIGGLKTLGEKEADAEEKARKLQRTLDQIKVPDSLKDSVKDFLDISDGAASSERSIESFIQTSPQLKAFVDSLEGAPEDLLLMAQGAGLLDAGMKELGLSSKVSTAALADFIVRGAKAAGRGAGVLGGAVATGVSGSLSLIGNPMFGGDKWIGDTTRGAARETGRQAGGFVRSMGEIDPMMSQGLDALGGIARLTAGLAAGTYGALGAGATSVGRATGRLFGSGKEEIAAAEAVGAWEPADHFVDALSVGGGLIADSAVAFWDVMAGPKAQLLYKGLLKNLEVGLTKVALNFSGTVASGMEGALTGDFTAFNNQIMGMATGVGDIVTKFSSSAIQSVLKGGTLLNKVIGKAMGPMLKVPSMVLGQINKIVMGPALKAIAAPMKEVTSGIANAFSALVNSEDLTKAREKVNAEADASIAALRGQMQGTTDVAEYQRLQAEIQKEEFERRKAFGEKGGDEPEDILDAAFQKALKLIETLIEKLPGLVVTVMDMLIEHLPALIGGMAEAFAQTLVAFSTKLPALMTTIINALINALPVLIDAIVTSLPLILDGILLGLIAILENLGSMVGQILVGLAQAIGGMLRTLLARAPQIIAGIVQAIPEIITAFVEFLPVLFEEIARLLPALIAAIIIAIPQIVAALIKSIPKLVFALIMNLPRIIWAIVKGLGKGIHDVVVKPLYRLADAFNAVKDAWYALGRWLSSLWRGTKSFGSKVWEGTKRVLGKGWLWHDGGMVSPGHRGPGTAAALHALGAPAFAQGGVVMSDPLDGMRRAFMGMRRGLVDDVPAVLQSGESVLNRRATAAIGGESAVNAINSGQDMGGTTDISVSLNASGDGINQAAAALLPFLISSVTVEASRPGSGLRNEILTSGRRLPIGTKSAKVSG